MAAQGGDNSGARKGCGHQLPRGARAHALYCSPACRQAAYRRRVNPELVARGARRLEARTELRILEGGVGTVDALPSPSEIRRSLGFAPEPSRLTREPRSTDTVHACTGRVCAVCTTERFLEIRVPTRARIRRSPELVAEAMRAEGGDLGPALDAGYGYRQALRIRAGWRGDGRLAEPIPYTSRGYYSGLKSGPAQDRRPTDAPHYGADVLERTRDVLERARVLAELAVLALELRAEGAG